MLQTWVVQAYKLAPIIVQEERGLIRIFPEEIQTFFGTTLNCIFIHDNGSECLWVNHVGPVVNRKKAYRQKGSYYKQIWLETYR